MVISKGSGCLNRLRSVQHMTRHARRRSLGGALWAVFSVPFVISAPSLLSALTFSEFSFSVRPEFSPSVLYEFSIAALSIFAGRYCSRGALPPWFLSFHSHCFLGSLLEELSGGAL